MKPRIFRKLTGISVIEFAQLCEKIRPKAQSLFKTTGRPPVLATLEDKLALLLIYYRTYATHEFLGYFVGLDNSNVCRLFRKLEPLVAGVIHIKKDRTLTKDKIEELLLDVTEQPIQRPKNKGARKKYYSGKKKRHTHKIELVMERGGKIVNISHSNPGRKHDFRIRKESDVLPKDAPKYADLGYQGLEKFCKNVLLPFKKPKGGKLTPEQKSHNKGHSQIRIAVEHKFSELKKFRILGETYRNFRKKHHLRFNIIAGIVNFQNGF
jgi:hypothetical protein